MGDLLAGERRGTAPADASTERPERRENMPRFVCRVEQKF